MAKNLTRKQAARIVDVSPISFPKNAELGEFSGRDIQMIGYISDCCRKDITASLLDWPDEVIDDIDEIYGRDA